MRTISNIASITDEPDCNCCNRYNCYDRCDDM